MKKTQNSRVYLITQPGTSYLRTYKNEPRETSGFCALANSDYFTGVHLLVSDTIRGGVGVGIVALATIAQFGDSLVTIATIS